jgi:hypothetical protein
MKTETDEKFEIFDEELDSWFGGLKHYVASLLATGVSGGGIFYFIFQGIKWRRSQQFITKLL